MSPRSGGFRNTTCEPPNSDLQGRPEVGSALGMLLTPVSASLIHGAVAQLVAHLHGMQGVRGSSPLSSTKEKPAQGHFPERERAFAIEQASV